MTCHYWWAEPAALIPDVDYGRPQSAVKHKSEQVVKNFADSATPNRNTGVKSGRAARRSYGTRRRSRARFASAMVRVSAPKVPSARR